MKTKVITTIMITLFLASMLSMAFVAPAAATPDSGIVGLWHFNEGTGDVAYDSSGLGNDGRLGSEVGSDVNDPTWVSGKFGMALSFDGNPLNPLSPPPDYVDCGTGAAPITNDFTFGAWIKTSTKGGCIVSNRESTPPYSGFMLLIQWDHMLYFQLNDQSNYHIFDVGTVVVDDGEWHLVHLVVDRANNKAHLYVDGEIDATNVDISAVSGSIESSNGIHVGIDSYALVNPFNGIIDEVCIWNRALSADEIKSSIMIESYYTDCLFSDNFNREDGNPGPDWEIVGGTWEIEGGQLSGDNPGPYIYPPSYHYGTARLKIRTDPDFTGARIIEAKVTFWGWYDTPDSAENDYKWQRVGIIIQKDPSWDENPLTPGKFDWALLIRGDNRLYLLDEYVAWDNWVAFTPEVDHTYKMKMMWDGVNTLKGKAWEMGTPEPDWMLTWMRTDVRAPASIALYCSYAHAHFDDVFVAELPLNQYGIWNPDTVPVNTLDEWVITVKVTGGFADVENVMVQGGIGADLVVLGLHASQGSTAWKRVGKNQQGAWIITWDVGDLGAGEEATLTICVATGLNPRNMQEYTQPGTHYLDGGFSATYSYLDVPYQTFKTDRLPIEAVLD